MTIITIQAIYRNGQLEPLEKLDLPDGAQVELRISTLTVNAKSDSTDTLFGAFPELAALTDPKFHFAPGEPDTLLDDIKRLRLLDLEEDDTESPDE